MFRYWVLPFEALSVLLLSALVGAIVLSRNDVDNGNDGMDKVGSIAPGEDD
jgi:NADH-quinone oxidoreductase subunit J